MGWSVLAPSLTMPGTVGGEERDAVRSGFLPTADRGGKTTGQRGVDMVGSKVIEETYPEEQAKVERRIQEIMSAARTKDVDRLESYHLFGPKFTKFDDFEPLDRQDAETTRRLEREAITGVKEFTPSVSGLKVDVFGPLAVATFVFDYGVSTHDGEKLAVRARSTMVFAKDGPEWKIVHEHFSPFKGNP
jgi:ketosteroid isomerase-like protein